MINTLQEVQQTQIRSLGREDSPGEGNGNPLQYSCLENATDRGAWRASVHGVTKSRTQLTNTCARFSFDVCTSNLRNCRRRWEAPGCGISLASQRRERHWPRQSHSLQERFLGWTPCRGRRNARRRAAWKLVGITPDEGPAPPRMAPRPAASVSSRSHFEI